MATLIGRLTTAFQSVAAEIKSLKSNKLDKTGSSLTSAFFLGTGGRGFRVDPAGPFTAMFTDNGYASAGSIQNLGLTNAGHGIRIESRLGTDGVTAIKGGQLGMKSLDVFTSATTRATQWEFTVLNASGTEVQVMTMDTVNGLVANYRLATPQGILATRMSGSNIISRQESGFYDASNVSPALGFPFTSSFAHVISCTHSNTGNYYAFQITASFFDTLNTAFFRVTANSAGKAWTEFKHATNSPASVYTITVAGNATTFASPAPYRAGYIDVLKNGRLLVPDLDYTATDGVNINLADPSGGATFTIIKQHQTVNTGRVILDKFNSPLINFRRGIFDIRDEGAVVGQDCSAPMVEAMRKLNRSPAGGSLVLGGRYVATQQIDLVAANQRALQVIGDGVMSSISFSGALTGGLNVTAGDGSNRVSVENMSVRAANAPNLQSILKVRGGGYYQGVNIDHIYIEGASTTNPAVFLDVINPLGSTVRDVYIEGARGSYGDGGGIGLRIYADIVGMVDFILDHVKVNRTGTCCSVDGRLGPGGVPIEGAEFRNCIFVGSQNGLLMNSGNAYLPGLNWKGGHINVQKYAMALTNIAQFKISDLLVYMDISNGPIAMISLNNCRDINIHHNTFTMVNQMGATNTAVACHGVFNSASTETKVLDNTFNMLTQDAVIYNAASSTRLSYGGNEKTGGGGFLITNLADAAQVWEKAANKVW